MAKYKHIFFDLDRTLWDFDSNSRNALTAIHGEYDLCKLGINEVEKFITVYQRINENLWSQYRRGAINKQKLRRSRFALALAEFGCSDKALGTSLDEAYIALSPHQTGLMPEALETLAYLAEKYHMHIITNGFEEVQHIKLHKSGLAPFFKTVLTSEKAMARKPDPIVFHMAMQMAGAVVGESLMIGDDLETDISGARSVWMDQVYFNPEGRLHNEEVSYEIKSLNQLTSLL